MLTLIVAVFLAKVFLLRKFLCITFYITFAVLLSSFRSRFLVFSPLGSTSELPIPCSYRASSTLLVKCSRPGFYIFSLFAFFLFFALFLFSEYVPNVSKGTIGTNGNADSCLIMIDYFIEDAGKNF